MHLSLKERGAESGEGAEPREGAPVTATRFHPWRRAQVQRRTHAQREARGTRAKGQTERETRRGTDLRRRHTRTEVHAPPARSHRCVETLCLARPLRHHALLSSRSVRFTECTCMGGGWAECARLPDWRFWVSRAIGAKHGLGRTRRGQTFPPGSRACEESYKSWCWGTLEFGISLCQRARAHTRLSAQSWVGNQKKKKKICIFWQ